MRIKKYIGSFGAAVLAALYLAGCGNGAASAGQETAGESVIETSLSDEDGSAEEAAAGAESEESSESAAAESEAAESQPDESVDRYEEIMDRSQDQGKMTMYFLDLEVGPEATDKSGDSTILISPDGKVMLLDAGHPDAAELVIQALKDLGIEQIDYLVASHPHIDHIGGIPAVAKEFPIKTAYQSYVEYTTQTYQNYVAALKEGGMEVINVSTGDTFDFGSQVKVEVLGPEKDIVYPDGFPDNSTQFLNNKSLLLKFTYGESTALFGGDLYIAQEREYIDQYGDKLQADVAKADHHGKDTSNLKKWIKTVSPKIVVAMGDEMGSMDVYNNYLKVGAEYHHTLYDGIVKVIMDDQKHYEVIDQKDSWMN